MNLILSIFAIIVFASTTLPVLAQVSNTNPAVATHTINFRRISVSQVLQIYQNVTHLRLAVAPDVLQEKRTISLAATAQSTAEVAKLLEEALLKQTGIVIKHIDDKRASAAYRDQSDGSK